VTALLARTPGTTRDAAATGLGFVRRGRDRWLRNGFELDQTGAWLALRHQSPFSGDPLRDELGTPGLWRALPSRIDPERWDRVFDLPALRDPEDQDVVQDAASGTAAAPHPCAPLVAWAEALEHGHAAHHTASHDDVEAWLPPGQRSVRRGAQLAQIEPFLGNARFGLAIPELARVPAALSPAREAWLVELCTAMQLQWHLVRVGLDGDRVRAEVDLSGAPASLCNPLFQLALAALRRSAAWVLPALALVTDPKASSEALDHHPRRADACLESKGAA